MEWFVVVCGGLWCFVVFSATQLTVTPFKTGNPINEDFLKCCIIWNFIRV